MSKRKKAVVKEKFTVKVGFKTTKKEYKVGETIELSTEKQIQYLQSINVI